MNPTNTGTGGGPNALGIQGTMSDLYANNTDALAMRYTQAAGQGMNSGSLGLNQDYANNLPYVYLMLQGNNAMNPANAPGSATYFDWSKNYMDQGNSPNGSAISPQQVMAALFTKDVKNPIYQFVYKNGTAKPDEIVNNFVSLMQAGMEHQVPPFVLQAMTGMYKQYGAMWIDAKSQGYAGDFTDFLAEQGLSPANLGM